jgi:hypothetical protein
MEYISVNRQIDQPPTDPDYISIKEYVKTIAAGGSFAKNKITPLALAAMLEKDATKALNLVKNIKTDKDQSLMYEVADVKTWAKLGLYFAEKIKGGVALQSYYLNGKAENKRRAVKHLENALRYWDEVVAITRPIYNDMPLVHFSESNDNLRFHWANLRPEVAKDVELAKGAIPLNN